MADAQRSGIVNPDFIPACENSVRPFPDKRELMAFGLFRKRLPDQAAPTAAPAAPQPAAPSEPAAVAETDSAREILELLELELGAMIRQLERAANSVAGGAEA